MCNQLEAVVLGSCSHFSHAARRHLLPRFKGALPGPSLVNDHLLQLQQRRRMCARDLELIQELNATGTVSIGPVEYRPG